MRPASAILVDGLRAAWKKFLPVRIGNAERLRRSLMRVAGGRTSRVGGEEPKDWFDELVVGGDSHARIVGVTSRASDLTNEKDFPVPNWPRIAATGNGVPRWEVRMSINSFRRGSPLLLIDYLEDSLRVQCSTCNLGDRVDRDSATLTVS